MHALLRVATVSEVVSHAMDTGSRGVVHLHVQDVDLDHRVVVWRIGGRVHGFFDNRRETPDANDEVVAQRFQELVIVE